MDSPENIRNYLKIQNLILNTATRFLRIYFVNLWNHHYSNTADPWENTIKYHKKFANGIGKKFFDQSQKIQKDILLAGNIELWDLPLLINALKYLQPLTQQSRSQCEPKFQFICISKLNQLKDIRHQIAHHGTIELDTTTFNSWWNLAFEILYEFGLSKEEINAEVDLKFGIQCQEENEAIKKASELKDKGNDAFRKKKYEEAFKFYSRAIGIEGLSKEVLGVLYSNRSTCHVKMGNLDEAKSDAKRVITLLPLWFKGYSRLAKVYEMREDFFNARKYYEVAAQFDPEPEGSGVLKSIENCRLMILAKTWRMHTDPTKQFFTTEDYTDMARRAGIMDPMLPIFQESYKNLLEQGQPAFLCQEGNKHRYGLFGYKQNLEMAVKFYTEAASKDNAQGIYYLGVLTLEGHGVERNVFEAVKMFQKAAVMPHFIDNVRNLGVAESQHLLGLLYAEGCAVPKNIQTAVMWYEKALENGIYTSANNLGLIYGNGKTSEGRNIPKAVLYWKLASYGGNVKSMENIAYYYLYVNFNQKEAQNWYKMAEAHNSVDLKSQESKFMSDPSLTQDFKLDEFRLKLKKELQNTEFKNLMEFKFSENQSLNEEMMRVRHPESKIFDRKGSIVDHRQTFSETKRQFQMYPESNHYRSILYTSKPILKQSPILGLLGLQPIYFKDMTDTTGNDRIFEGHVLKATVIEDAILGMPSVALLTQDDNGDLMKIYVYNYPQRKETQDEIGFGCVFNLMNPYYKLMADGTRAIRVDDPSLLIKCPDLRDFKRCRYCGKADGGKLQCRKCRRVYYCSKDSRTAW